MDGISVISISGSTIGMSLNPYNMNKAKVWGAVKCSDRNILRAIAAIGKRTVNTFNLCKLITRVSQRLNDGYKAKRLHIEGGTTVTIIP